MKATFTVFATILFCENTIFILINRCLTDIKRLFFQAKSGCFHPEEVDFEVLLLTVTKH